MSKLFFALALLGVVFATSDAEARCRKCRKHRVSKVIKAVVPNCLGECHKK